LRVLTTSPLLVGINAARSQSQERIPHVGYLLLAPASDTPSPERAAFLKGLRDLGYVEGKNIVIVYRSAEWDVEQLPRLSRQFAAEMVNLIFAPSDDMGKQATQAAPTIPVVVGAMLDPLDQGVVSSLASPGANLTGLSVQAPELVGKRFQLLREVLPGSKRAARSSPSLPRRTDSRRSSRFQNTRRPVP
jgi:putative ABC transport system substrate-binding protein